VPEENKPAEQKPAQDEAKTNISPSVSDVTGEPIKKDPGANPADSKIHADPLTDGTVPTVLAPGESHRSVAKKPATIDRLYRKADITTTLLTFLAVAVAGGILLGAYYFLNKPKTKSTPPPKVTSLNSQSLQSLNDFFAGNTAGNSSQVLTINPSSLFTNRVGISSDLKVTGAASVSGPTSLGQLVVDQNSELGVTDVRGSLNVAGPATIQSPLTVSNSATVKGDLSVSGNGSYGGSISAASITTSSLSVTGNLNLDNNLIIGGQQPSASGSALVQGNDSAGVVSVTSGGANAGSTLATVNFHTAFSAIPIINITPVGASSAKIMPFITASASSFSIGGAAAIPAGSYTFNYWVVQY
jgi:hypothetical protein